MYARAVEDAAVQLRDLRREEWEELGLGLLALVLAIGATKVSPVLALPLFLGGLVVVARGMRTLWRRWDLVERLSEDRDAYVISEVLARAARETTMERRRTFAAVIRTFLREPVDARIALAAEELEALAADLEDGGLALHPSSGVACFHLLSDASSSPLLRSGFTPEELRSRIEQIRSGFARRSQLTRR